MRARRVLCSASTKALKLQDESIYKFQPVDRPGSRPYKLLSVCRVRGSEKYARKMRLLDLVFKHTGSGSQVKITKRRLRRLGLVLMSYGDSLEL